VGLSNAILLAATASVIASPTPVIASEARQSMPQSPSPVKQVYNIAIGDRTTLNILFALLRDNLAAHGVGASTQPVYRDFRAGDVRHSQADIGKAQRLLGYAPTHSIRQGVQAALGWYVENQGKQAIRSAPQSVNAV
jgi:UDP-N-acetylglucosamine 4-epimerase